MIKQISLLIRKKIKESFSRKKKGLIFLNSVPIQNVQLMSQIQLLCKQFFYALQMYLMFLEQLTYLRILTGKIRKCC